MFVLVSLPDHRFACSGSVMSAPGIGVFRSQYLVRNLLRLGVGDSI